MIINCKNYKLYIIKNYCYVYSQVAVELFVLSTRILQLLISLNYWSHYQEICRLLLRNRRKTIALPR